MRVDDKSKVDHKKTLRNFSIMVVLGIALLLGGQTINVTGLVIFGNLILISAIIMLLNLYVLTPLARKFRAGFLPWLGEKI